LKEEGKMKTKRLCVLMFLVAIVAVASFGCATQDQEAKWREQESLRKGLNDYPYLPYTGTARPGKPEPAPAPVAKPAAPAPAPAPVAKAAPEARTAELPPGAKAGECYARVLIPPKYQTNTVRVLSRQASEKIETIPAKYEVVEEKVVVKQASKRIEEVPAEYNWVEEKVLVEPARTEWKKGRGLIEKVDNTTGEIMCLVEIPASYQTVRRQVLVKPAGTREVEIPAEYQTIKVTKMVSPPQVKRTPIAEEYETVTRTEKVSEGYMEWKRVLCETNITSDVVAKIQDALMKAGHNPGAINGVMGSATQAAIMSYQKQKGLAQGELTYETIESLGVKIN